MAWRLAIFAMAALVLFGADAMAAPPKRVVSMNVCTDQLALLIGARDQIVSVSYLAHDPGVSVLADKASSIPVNHGLAEEIFLLEPDLVLAGSFTTRTTVAMLRRLGIPVEEFTPENNFDDIRTNIRRMGHLLGRPERAQALIAELDAGLSALKQDDAASKPTAISLAASLYTVGTGTLADEIIRTAGFRNLAAELGFVGGGQLPLETVILQNPDLLITNDRNSGPLALAQEVLDHPALRKAFAGKRQADFDSRYWICGAPFTLRAVDMLRRYRTP